MTPFEAFLAEYCAGGSRLDRLETIAAKAAWDAAIEHVRHTGPSERLIIALESCASKLAQLGHEFSSVRFTDRHGDGPVCLALAKHARTVLDEVRRGATASGEKHG